MRHFKWPLIMTAIAFVAVIILGIAAVFWMQGSGGNLDKRARLLGQGLGTLTIFAIAPFWIYGTYQFGKERRAAQSKLRTKTPSPRRKPGS